MGVLSTGKIPHHPRLVALVEGRLLRAGEPTVGRDVGARACMRHYIRSGERRGILLLQQRQRALCVPPFAGYHGQLTDLSGSPIGPRMLAPPGTQSGDTCQGGWGYAGSWWIIQQRDLLSLQLALAAWEQHECGGQPKQGWADLGALLWGVAIMPTLVKSTARLAGPGLWRARVPPARPAAPASTAWAGGLPLVPGAASES